MPPTTFFYTSLTDKERTACDAMPALFRLQNPSDQGFAEAYAFMRSATDSAQRGVAKRWINSHLSDMEYALQPVEWARYPLCMARYTALGLDIDDDDVGGAVGLRAQWARAVGLMATGDAPRTNATPSGPGI
jgi:hypothetical protein